MTQSNAVDTFDKPQSSFSEFELASPILKALEDEQLEHPTPIQQMAIPSLLEGKDMVGLAQTGTGKTAAFVLPVLCHLNARTDRKKGQPPHALILTPTRELAQQILDNVRKLSAHTDLKSLAVYGGTRYEGQIGGLRRGTNIVVATPGRLEDLMKRQAIDLSQITHFILDEADHMLDLGFYPAITRISEHLPKQRQTMLFSATMPAEIQKLTRRFLVDPIQLEAPKAHNNIANISQVMVMLKEDQKRDILTTWLHKEEVESCVIFVRTKRKADMLSDFMSSLGFSIDALHGDMRQVVRRKVLNKFRAGEITALVATDVAARGIDIPAISHVINFDLPETPDAYTHRIGRTGRAGRKGTAISLCSSVDRDKLRAIQKRLTLEPEFVNAEGEPLPAGAASPPSKSRKPKQGATPARRKPWKKAASDSKRPRRAKEPREEIAQPTQYTDNADKAHQPPKKKKRGTKFNDKRHASASPSRPRKTGKASAEAGQEKRHNKSATAENKPKPYRSKFKKTASKSRPNAKTGGMSKLRRKR